MAGSRTLKLSILAETKDLVAGLNTATKGTETFTDKVTDFGKKAAVAFAAAGVAALAFAADAVKAAAQDQAAQEKLAETIRATTGATAAQVKGVEDYITKTSIAVGVADDELRPALSRLVRSTQDTEQAQRLLNLALDLSVATGKPLESISNALGRAYDGNTTALGRLGLGLDANLIKSKDNEAIIKSLETTYGSFAEGAAETAAVKFERIRIATDEAKESIGAALLPAVEQLMDYVLVTVVPNLESFINALTGNGSLTEATENGTQGAYLFGEQVKKVIKTVINLKDEILIVGGVLAALFVTSKIAAAVAGTIALVRGVITVMNSLRVASIIAGIAKAFALNPIAGVAAVAVGAAVLAGAAKLVGSSISKEENAAISGAGAGFSGTTPGGQSFAGTLSVPKIASVPKITGGVITSGGVKTATTVAKTAAVASSGITAAFNPAGFRAGEEASMSGTTINLTVNGALDKEGTARTIVNTLNDSYYRGTGGGSALQIQ
jgi:hypothetical protein